MHILSVVDAALDDMNHIGKITAKIKATIMKHTRTDRRIADNDVQHGHVAHRNLKFKHNHIII